MDESRHCVAESKRSYQYADAHDRNMHSAEIQAIAEKVQRPVSEVAAYYEEVLERMTATATVTHFLAVFVSKKVREHFRRKAVSPYCCRCDEGAF